MSSKEKGYITMAFICLFMLASKPVDDRLIFKEYNGLKPQRAGSGCGKYPRDKYDSLEYEAYDIVCQITYVGEVKVISEVIDLEKGRGFSNLSRPIIIVKLLSIISNESSKSYVNREVFSFSRQDMNKLSEKYNGHSKILLDNGGGAFKQKIWWLGEKYIVYISSQDIDIPQEIIDDYQTKYPPSYTFTAEDFDIQKIMKSQIKLQLKKIKDLDDDRGWINRTFFKGDEYVGMSLQCNYELAIRCQVGLTDQAGKVDCPAAFMMDDDARKKTWKELEQEVEKREIVTDNINWNRMDDPKCSYSNKDWNIDARKALNMDEDDLRDAEKSIMKKTGESGP